MTIIIRVLALIIIAQGLTACIQTREQTFDATLRAYEQVFRWRNIEKVNQFRKQPLVFSNVAKERFKNIKVTGYEVTNIESKTALSTIVTVNIKYYHEHYARERTIQDKQEWNFDAENELWSISSPIPNF